NTRSVSASLSSSCTTIWLYVMPYGCRCQEVFSPPPRATCHICFLGVVLSTGPRESSAHMLRRTAESRRATVVDRLSNALRESRLGAGISTKMTAARTRVIPLHWSNLFGVAAMACLVIVVITGIFLMFVYAPSSEQVRYTGTYPPLIDIEMSRAYASTLAISFDIPGGLLMRQAHHWAALLLPATVILQIL